MTMDERRKGKYIENTYAAPVSEYSSAFATRVLQSTYVCGKGERV
jgi:hypothetical protein